MPSPFPGMNPYLEHPHVWSDFHMSFIVAFRTAITPTVSPRYFVQIQEHIYLREVEGDRRQARVSDVHLSQPPGGSPADGGVATAPSPVKARLPRYVRERVAYLEVRDRDERAVVTVIELLSPSNKATGNDRDSFMDKRRELVTSHANYVELDFLRGGPRMPMQRRPACDYYAMVSRPADRPDTDWWPFFLRDPMPSIPIPLRVGEPEPLIDLQAVLHQVYDTAGYAPHIYRSPPEPRLLPPDDAWAAEIARAATPAT